jgi:ABC-type transporter Mla subunit MlaD
MDARPHYFKIGIFVLVAVVLIVVAIILFSAGLFAQNRLYIESYFAEPITGLSEGSQVEFRGVVIGRVEQIGFVGSVYKLEPNTPAFVKYASYVRVVSAVFRKKLPEMNNQQVEAVLQRMVERGLRVRVSTNILTEQAYLEIDFLDPNRFPVEPVPWVSQYPVIPSAPAQLTTIKNSLDRILGEIQSIDFRGLVSSLDRLFTSLNTAIAEARLAELSTEARGLLRVGREKLDALDTATLNADMERLLASLNRAVTDANIPALSQDAQRLMAQWRTTSTHLEQLLAPPPGVARAANVPEVIARLNQTIVQLNKLLAAESSEITAVLADFRNTIDRLNDLIMKLEENPSELLFSRPPPKTGVLK